MIQISKELMEKFINNTCTDEELAEINDWLRASDDNATDLFGTELAAMLAFEMRNDNESTERISKKIRQRIMERQAGLKLKRRKRMIMYIISGIAAMICILLTFGWLVYKPQDVRMIRIAATTTTRTVTLPDSTVVYLNNNSQLRYPASFNGDSRTVELLGEGYFEVTHDTGNPFIVKGKHLIVEVLGTQFHFNSRDSAYNSVSLIEGSVEVSTSEHSESIILAPGQKVNYNITSGEMTVETPKTQIDLAWHSRIIPFENANIGEIRDILYKLYGIPVQLDDDVDYSETYSGGTIYYKDIDSTLTQLANTLPITFVNHGDMIEIHVVKD